MIFEQSLVVILTLLIEITILILFIFGSIKGGKVVMKNRLISLLLSPLLLLSFANNQKSYVLNEATFFLVMTNIQHYPEDYLNKDLTFDSFTYELEDTSGNKHLCVVRKCASGFGCKCGKDTIIGFIINNDIDLPKPKNQYEDTNDKSWVHVIGNIESTHKTEIEIYSVDNQKEKVQFLSLTVKEYSIIEDYSDLHYYVDK